MAGSSIFVGYRRDDTADVAGRLFDWLVKEFGNAALFKDVDTLRPGVDFARAIEDVLSNCRIFLALIGNRWAGATGNDQAKRIMNPDDWVRVELELALSKPGLVIIPVLINGARMPSETDLPTSIARLTRLHAAEVRRDPDFRRDVERLIGRLRECIAAEAEQALDDRKHPIDEQWSEHDGRAHSLLRSLGLKIVAEGPSRRYPKAVPGPASGYRYWATYLSQENKILFGVQRVDGVVPVAHVERLLQAGFKRRTKASEFYVEIVAEQGSTAYFASAKNTAADLRKLLDGA